ncbi:MAG: molybdopterin-guanine dinucleotide biosynthesis protein B [Desulfobulbaceae bacterium]|nr:molybdopterin-guanine dinucleotide biosynthesis protein B [Desulfobulbaceae bacterium]
MARPNHGKTTLLEKLLAELARRNIKAGVIKHHVHEFEFDKKGKDTWRHKQAGAHTVILSSPAGIGLVRDVVADKDVDELVNLYFSEMDIVLTEGYKWEDYPKIEVFRAARGGIPLDGRNATWAAFVSDTDLETDLPRFGLDDISPLADFLLALFPRTPGLSLIADNRPVLLSDEKQEQLAAYIRTLVEEGQDTPRSISLKIRYDR